MPGPPTRSACAARSPARYWCCRRNFAPASIAFSGPTRCGWPEFSNAGRRGCFVTGTDTGVGKTVVAASIVARLRQRGVAVRALKPLITGLEDPPDPVWPRDHELLARVAGATPQETILAGYGPAVSPHLAAELTGTPPPVDARDSRNGLIVIEAAQRSAAERRTVEINA